MRPKVSVIVPIYNSEKYLKKCIESILNQTLDEIEIILINDGSTDNSHKICLEYREKFPQKINYINNKNIGCSASRNLGIEISQGEYIGFVDSDDYIEKDMYNSMYTRAEKENLDLVITGIRYVKENKVVKTKIPNLLEDKYSIFKEKNLINYVVNKLFKKSIIIKENIKFITNSHYQEDMVFSFQFSLKAKKIVLIKEANYNYYLHDSNSVYNISKRLGVFISYKKLYNVLIDEKTDKQIYKYFYKLFNLYAIGGSFLLLAQKDKVLLSDYKKYKKIFFSKCLKTLPLPLTSKLYLIEWYIFMHILRRVNIIDFLLKIRRKIRKES